MQERQIEGEEVRDASIVAGSGLRRAPVQPS